MHRGEATRDSHLELVVRVLRHVRDHHPDRLTLAELAEVAGCSPFHFLRTFHRMVGRRPIEHLRDVRLLQAAVALRTTDRPVLQIALDVGYETHEGFTRAFHRQFDCSPSVFRQRCKNEERGRTMSDSQFLIGLVKIPVTDFARATAFYREVLGLEEEFAVEAYGWAQYRTKPVPLCLYVAGAGGGDGTPGGDTGIHLVVPDAGVLCRELTQRGAILVCDLTTSDDGGSFFVVRDPDGNTLKICQAVG
jgi:AraC-like DNA-binding protein/catechol 2,3-dioxygenase-like lactoylglutathione lyase family enzyme